MAFVLKEINRARHLAGMRPLSEARTDSEKFYSFSEWKAAAKAVGMKIKQDGELANVVNFSGTKKLKIVRWTADLGDNVHGGEFFKGAEWDYGSLTRP